MFTDIDQKLFLFLNSSHSPLWDRVMLIISAIPTWMPLYLAIITLLVLKYKRKMMVLVFIIALMITASDQLSVVIKNNVRRPRPCHETVLEGKVHLVDGRCGGIYGFVSSHASNSFAIAFLSLLLIRKRWFSTAMIIWALIIGYSRIYLGVHYPGDVLFGSLLGSLTGWGAYLLFDFLDSKFLMESLFFNPEKKEHRGNADVSSGIE